MALAWPPKDPDEVLDYSIDWSRFLEEDTISTSDWLIYDDTGTLVEFNIGDTINTVLNADETATSTVTTIYLGGGTINRTYTLINRIITGAGLISERSVKIRMVNK